MTTKMMDYLITNRVLLSKPYVAQNFKGYVIFENRNGSICYSLSEFNVVPEITNPYEKNKYYVFAEINDLTSAECDIEKITKSVAYANISHKYKNVTNKINNKRKELANLEKKIKIAENKLQTFLKIFMPIMVRHQGETAYFKAYIEYLKKIKYH